MGKVSAVLGGPGSEQAKFLQGWERKKKKK